MAVPFEAKVESDPTLSIILHTLMTQAMEAGGEENNERGNGGPYIWHPAESFKSSSKIISFRKNTSESPVTSYL